MRLGLVTIIILGLVIMAGAAAFAGDYHTGTGLKCYQCHIMHQTKSHGYGDDSREVTTPWLPAAGQVYGSHLLKYADSTSTCLSCHNSGDGKDVFKGFNPDATHTASTINRVGGWFGLTTDASPDYAGVLANSYGHDLNNGNQTPPGGSTTASLGCSTCHDPHGNASYRNLKLNDADGTDAGITYASATNDPSKEVFQKQATGLKYDVSDVSYNAVGGASHYESFCVSCHTDIHSTSAPAGGWLKHPTLGRTIAYTEGTVSPLKTLGGLPEAGGAGPLVAGQVSCVTCHKAHGSDHPFGLVYDNRTTAVLEDGTGTSSGQIRTTCKHCHDKGLTATE